jgi:hypothetical protein
MVDALIHFADTLSSCFAPGNPLAQVWLQTAGARTEAAAQIAQITAGLGRAKTHGESSLSHADPGATSFRLADEPQQRRTAGERSLPLPLVAQGAPVDRGSAATRRVVFSAVLRESTASLGRSAAI